MKGFICMTNLKIKLEELNRPNLGDYKNQSKKPITLLLDNVRSAQNIGSIFRTSDAFNIERLILCGISATPPHKDILKTALGSTESVDWLYEANATEAAKNLITSGYSLISIEQARQSTALNEFTPIKEAKYVLILGNEVDGVNQDIIDLSQQTIEIPQFGTKHSLNVAVSAGIVLWDIYQKLYLTKS